MVASWFELWLDDEETSKAKNKNTSAYIESISRVKSANIFHSLRACNSTVSRQALAPNLPAAYLKAQHPFVTRHQQRKTSVSHVILLGAPSTPPQA
eukprot:4612032-Amphidinium_carterae.2